MMGAKVPSVAAIKLASLRDPPVIRSFNLDVMIISISLLAV
jgi:hypothetical protein